MVGDAHLDGGLGASVGIRRSDRTFFGNRYHVGKAGRVAVDGSGGGKDDVRNIVLGHRAQKADGTVNIDTVVFEGNLCRFSDSL